MKVVQINDCCGIGSVGKICVAVSRLLTERSIENSILYTYGHSDYTLGSKYARRWYTKLQALKSRVFGNYGFNSQYITKKLIKKLEQIQPDIIHLHILHGHNVHLTMLFDYIRKNHIKVFWTFHDCWAFTGYCVHFTYAKCDKWKVNCAGCPQRRRYSWFFDNAAQNFRKKREALRDIDLTVITPSQWLADVVRESFFRGFPVKVIHNGIDLDVFQPTQSDIRAQYGIPAEKHMILGVALRWDVLKGLDVFTELSKRLDERFQIVLVGTNDEVDKHLPPNIISIHRTQNQQELAQLYTTADVFVNPTREEVLGMVNIESLACGTPVITYKTGGSPECIDSTCGSVVECEDISALEKEIIRVCTEKPFSRDNCIKHAQRSSQEACFAEYVRLYAKED